MVVASFPADQWREYVQEPGREGIFLVLAAFLASFLFIRTSARMIRSDRFPWWPGSVVTGGVHLHHLVWGIVLMMSGGTLGFALGGQAPWFQVSAVIFGIGVGLTFDEFALWVYLRDVYWAREGRQSIDAVAITAAFMGLIFLGINPLKIATGDDVLATLVSAGYTIGALLVAGVSFGKGRFFHGFGTLVFPPVGLWALVRLGKPGSPWARWRYGDRDPERQRRAEERFGPHRRSAVLVDRLRAAVGGFPVEARPRDARADDAAALERRQHDASVEAALEVQARAMSEAQAQARGEHRGAGRR
ncbi:unannotated protein [freshwater metagenome]|uniref:Unannotated protein n=1 Tax=freshwater metagenome TaxID=449393 RepID=A0A6J7IM82_9ZZZZ|nr:hypothetical protein [Actinomycetota bacterium]